MNDLVEEADGILKDGEIFDQEVKTTIERLMTLLVPVLTIILEAYQLPI